MGEWQEKVKAAHDMVSALCRPRGSEGSREWVMSIPADRSRDPDLVIADGLSAAEAHIDALTARAEQAEARLAKVVERIRVEMDEPCLDSCNPKNIVWRLWQDAKTIAEGRDE